MRYFYIVYSVRTSNNDYGTAAMCLASPTHPSIKEIMDLNKSNSINDFLIKNIIEFKSEEDFNKFKEGIE